MAEQNVSDLGPKTKVCGDCKLEKPLSEFNKHYGKPRSHCKPCHSASSQRWNDENKERRAVYVKGWHAENRETVRGHKQKYERGMTNEQTARRKDYLYWRHIKINYGLTPEAWQAMSDAQGGLCALCRKPGRTGRNGKFDVDHCHDTGRVRGLLCRHCNIALGILGDSPEKMDRVMDYLHGKHRA